MKVIVCGSRYWADPNLIDAVFDGLYVSNLGRPITMLHGGGKGADQVARVLADARHWRTECFAADWKSHGQKAGPMRNAQMAKSGATMCIAFKDEFDYSFKNHGGTEDMVRKAMDARFAAIHVYSHDRVGRVWEADTMTWNEPGAG